MDYVNKQQHFHWISLLLVLFWFQAAAERKLMEKLTTLGYITRPASQNTSNQSSNSWEENEMSLIDQMFHFFFLNVLDWSAEHDIRFYLLLYVLPEISNFHWWVNLVLITCVLILFPSLEVGLVGRVYPSDHDIDGHATDSWLSRSHHLDYCFRAPNIFFLFYLVLIYFFSLNSLSGSLWKPGVLGRHNHNSESASRCPVWPAGPAQKSPVKSPANQ